MRPVSFFQMMKHGLPLELVPRVLSTMEMHLTPTSSSSSLVVTRKNPNVLSSYYFSSGINKFFFKKAKDASDLGMHQEDVELVTEERRNAEFTDFFNQMQLEDDDDAHADPHMSNSESIYAAEEMQAHSQPCHSGSSGAAIASGHDC
jgi:hypothetical protein